MDGIQITVYTSTFAPNTVVCLFSTILVSRKKAKKNPFFLLSPLFHEGQLLIYFPLPNPILGHTFIYSTCLHIFPNGLHLLVIWSTPSSNYLYSQFI